MAVNVALVGSAPASVRLAPYGNPEWDVYGCSPGVYGVAPRVTQWFELHLWEPGQPWFSPEYVQWLTQLPDRGVTLWTGAPVPSVPKSTVLPYKDILDEFDPERWFCTSSLFWMMAMAIKAGAKKIGFWGVDMAANEEYEMQRAGIHFLTYEARKRGIEVGSPPESDLFTPRFRYGVDEWTHSFRKVRARMGELRARRDAALAELASKKEEAAFLTGALDDCDYFGKTWVTKDSHLGPAVAAVSPDALVEGNTLTGKGPHSIYLERPAVRFE